METLIKLCLLTLAAGLASSKFMMPSATFTADADGMTEATCSTECTEGINSGDVLFAENTTYSYAFDANTKIVPPTGSPEDVSEITIRGKANVVGMSKCGVLFYLKHVEIIQGSKTHGHTGLEGYPILMSFNNGKINPTVCMAEQDSVASMNLKRAIASTLQVSLVEAGHPSTIFETDNQGTCNTTYHTSWSDTIVVTKQKDLTQCTGHDKIILSELSSSQSKPVYQDSPFLSAIQQTKIILEDSVIKSVTSQETFLYEPFGSGFDAVTKIITTVNLNLKETFSVQSPSLPLNKCRSIGFEKPISMVGPTDSDTLVEATQLAVQNLEPTVEIDGAKSFSNLIELLKVAKKDDIISGFQKIKSGTGFDDVEMAKKIFIDALIIANSGESIEAVIELINNKEMSDSLVFTWFSNLANAKYPTKEAVVAASSLLNQKDLKEGYLGVGLLLNKYIKENQDFNSVEVKNALENLGAPLKNACDRSLSPNGEDITIASLKGIRNVQYINRDLENLIVKIITDKSALQRIRAAALSMVKIYAENPKIEKACENIFKDVSEDSELRLLAFKTFAISPSNYKATVIRNVLNDKNCQLQIQSFLLSYLKNLQTTNDENKLDEKRFYEGIKTTSTKKMLSDILRYSQNFEYSHKCPLLYSGVLLNGDVLFSHDSFLARSSSVSLKAFIFGKKYDVLNLDVRVENVEQLLGKLFGPEGYFAKSNGNTIDDVKNYITQAINYAKNRGLNNANSDLLFKKDGENTSEEDVKKMYLDMALNVFGKDVGWVSFQGLESEVTYEHIIDAMLNNFDNSIPDKNNLELNIKKQLPLMDYEKKYATGSGLPISLKIQATTAIKLNIATKVDLDNYFKNSKHSHFSLKFVPSGSFTLNTLLTVDGYKVVAGHKITSSLHTSTGSDISLKTVEDHGFEISYGLPLDTMDVISIKSEAFTIVQEEDSPLSEIPFTTNTERKTYTDTYKSLSESLGLSFCMQYDFPWSGDIKSLLPFSGPSSFSLKVLKVDSKLTKYILKGTYDLKSPTLKYVKFIFDTPNSNYNRDVEFFVAYDSNAHKTLIAEYRTPSNKIILKSKFINSDEEKIIKVKYIDGSMHILNIGVKSDKIDSETTKYSPIFIAAYSAGPNYKIEYHPDLPVFDLEGSFIVKSNEDSQSIYPSKLTLKDIAIVTPKSKHSLQGSVSLENNELKGDACLNVGRVTVNTNGYIYVDHPVYKTGGTIDMIRNEDAGEQLLLTDEPDEYEPTSKLMTLLYSANTISLSMSQELHFEQPYKFISNNHLLWDKDHAELNSDILIDNGALTMYGNISTSNILDSVLNVNMSIVPSTKDSGIYVLGLFEHSFVSNPSSRGYGNMKYVQDLNMRGGYLELNSECPNILGVYHFNTEHHLTDESFKYNLNYDIQGNPVLKIDMNVVTDDITLNINFDSPGSIDDKSFMIFHGWSKKENTYMFDAKLLWPGPENSSYLNANGEMVLDGLLSHMRGDIDFPAANLINLHTTVKSEPNPEMKDGGIASVRCISNGQTLLSEMFMYKLKIDDGEVHIFGKSISENSQNFIPIHFKYEYKNYKDTKDNVGKEITYKIELENDGHMLTYQKNLKVTNQVLKYRQLYKIDNDEQKNSVNLEYDLTDIWHWSYNLKFKFISPTVLHFFAYDNQNVLEYNSYIKVNDYSLDKEATVKIFSSEGHLTHSYKFRGFMDHEKSALEIIFGQREIRGLCHYSLRSIKGGYEWIYSGNLWLDYRKDADSKSSISGESYYSLDDGVSVFNEINLLVPVFNDKEMGFKSNIQMFKSWENPFRVILDLNIFSDIEQTLQLYTSLNRNIEDNGVLYSAELLAKSDGMALEYSLKDSVFVSNDKWGKHLEVYFMDLDNIKRPLELHFDLVPHGLNTKVNIFDTAVINVNSQIINSEDALNLHLTLKYNDHPYSFGLLFNSHPKIKYIMKWNDKLEGPKQLNVEGSITMDDSAVIRATFISNDGTNITSMGFVQKSLENKNWWVTNNQMNLEEWDQIWKSLKGQLIERFIDVHSNLKNIMLVVKRQRRLRWREARRVKSQYHALFDYASNEWSQISNELREDEYLLELPHLITNYTKFVFINAIDFIKYINLIEYGSIDWNVDINIDLSKIYGYYAKQMDLFLKNMTIGYNEIAKEMELFLNDLLHVLNQYTDKPMNEISAEPHSINDYMKDLMNKFIKMIKELKDTISNVQDISENYIKNLPMYNVLQDKIDKVKSYPYKDTVSKEIDKYLQELKATAPTKDFASFINSLRMYIHNVIYDIPLHQRDLINLRNKGIILMKSFVFNFSDYVNYDRAMTIYDTLCKLTKFSKNVLYMVSPDSHQNSNPSSAGNMLIDLSEYMQMYQKYLNPMHLLPPYDGHAVIIDSTYIITYNGKPYNFKPNTGCYTLAKDFVKNRFSVLAEYEDNVLTSISVLSGNDEIYSLQSGGSITVNGNNVDFPLIRDNVKTWKDFAFFGIDLSFGVTIKCTLELDIVMVCINGYYYRQVKGLLGAMYHEPTFDLIPDFNISDGIILNGKPSDDMLPFLNAYKVSGETEPTNIDLVQTDEPLSHSLFSGVSTLNSVFPIVSPIPYRTICNQIVSSGSSQEDRLDKACLVAKAYVLMAKQHYVTNCNIPDMCKYINIAIHKLFQSYCKDDVNDKTIATTIVDTQTIRSTTNIQRSIQSNVADIMILFEESEQNKQIFSELLRPFVEKTSKYFSKKHISDIQYTIIGYSGKPTDTDVHIYTYNKDNIEGILSNVPEWSASETIDDINTNGFSSQFVQSFKKVLDNNSKDKAYKLSVNYPFRPNAVKVVLSVAQTLYTQSLMDVSSYTFDYLTSCYTDQGIKFFLIAPINLKHPLEDEIFGAGGPNTMYTWSSLKGKPSDAQYTYGKSLETGLVMKTNGAMYDSNSFIDGTNAQKTNFLRSLSKAIVDTSTDDTTVVQTCSSSVYNGVAAFPKCVIVTA